MGFTKKLIDMNDSPKLPLISPEDVATHAARLKAHLARDSLPEVQAALEHPLVKWRLNKYWWFQRVALPGGSAYTTTLREGLEVSDPGYVNTLNGALTPDEGSILRPMPKWAYLKSIMPDLKGKTVLDIGCNNGFFSFAFAEELGARHVTGIEVMGEFLVGAQWLANIKASRCVEFRQADALLDLTIPKHDVVFMSEVHGHFIDPLFGILRGLNLANETLVLDGAAGDSQEMALDLGAGTDPYSGKLTYHAWLLSDGLMLNYLFLCGVEPHRVTRYFAPWPNHICYVIDTRGIADFRAANDFSTCNTTFLRAAFNQ